MHKLCTNRLEHREQTERGLDGGAVDKLLVGLGEVNTLNLLSLSQTNVLLKTSRIAVTPFISC